VFGLEKCKVLIKLPYIGTACVIIQRELSKLVSSFKPEIDLNIIYIGVKKIGHLFPNKDRLHFRFKSKVVYGIDCLHCDQKYYGSTIRLLSARMREHALAVQGKGHSSAADHCLSCNHTMNFYGPKVLASDNCQKRLRIKETLLIRKNREFLCNTMDSSLQLHVFT
jgi:hypothetical protein